MSIAVILCLLLFGSAGFAQDRTGSDSSFQVHIRLGLDNSNIISEESTLGSSLLFPAGGLGVRTPGFHDFSGALYTQVGGRGTYLNSNSVKQFLYYVDFPLHIKYRLFGAIDIIAGTQFSVLFHNKNIYPTRQAKSNVQQLPIRGKEVNPYGQAILAGAGIPLNNHLIFELSYLRSVKPVSKNFRFSFLRVALSWWPAQNSSSNRRFREIPYESVGDESYMTDKELASFHILNLKEGVLLVRLKSGRGQAAALIKRGDTTAARKLKERKQIVNREIIRQFRKYFDFCPVYYFYDDQSGDILHGKLEGNVLNDSLQPLEQLPSEISNFYVAGVGNVWPEASDRSYEGLVIMDKELRQLKDPFPYSVRAFHSLKEFGFSRSIKKLVVKLNSNLAQFYREILEE